MSGTLRERIPPGWRARLRRLNRWRWLAKRRALHEFGVRVRDQPRSALRYILLDPELDNFTYRLANEAELPGLVAAGLGVPEDAAGAAMFELAADVELAEQLEALLRRRARGRGLDYGYRYAWYAAVRARRPRLVVETGIHDGLGSAVLLRALERNAGEGHPGRLISFDILPDSGWLVPERLRSAWQPRFEATETGLAPALAGERVDLFFYDSLGAREHELFELRTVLAHAAPELGIVSARAANGALRGLCEEEGLAYREFEERALHFYPGRSHAMAARRASGRD